MREILFRWKRVDNGEWVEGSNYLRDPDLGKVSIGGYNHFTSEDGLQREEYCYEVEPRTVGQYICQLDEYAVRIFEGDVIELEDDEGIYYIVFWLEDAAQYLLDGEDEMIPFDSISCVFTVVGNIFDNPDLADW